MRERLVRLGVLVGLALGLAVAPAAQEADTLGVPADPLAAPAPFAVDSLAGPADTLGVDTLAAAAPRRAVGFAEAEPGRVVTAIPTRRPVFSVAELLGTLPGAFHYDLGVPGWPDGVAFGGLAPHRVALALDGVPAGDLFSGRPAWELLPLDVLAPLRLNARWGAAVGVDANLRAFAAPVPVTELRFRSGRSGIQFISATHGQTRRPGWLQRLGGDRARLQALAHVSGRKADGEYPSSSVSGWQLLARVGVALPAFALELTERHGRDRGGAQSGVIPTGALETVYDRDGATVGDPGAARETIRNDLAAGLRLPITAEPLTATVFWTAATFRYTNPSVGALPPTLDDTLAVRGDRVGVRLVQSLTLGPNRLFARAHAWLDRVDPGPAYPTPDERRALHLSVLDSLALGGFDVVLTGGIHHTDDATFPSISARVARALGGVRLFAEARRAGALTSRFEREGFRNVLAAQGTSGDERTLALAAGFDAALGPFDLGLRGEALQQTDPRLLVATDSVATFVTADGAFRRATATLTLGWRDRARRGVYLHTRANAHAFLNRADGDLHAREAAAVPPFWGDARLGFRALALFDGNLDLDLAARGRAWSAFRSRALSAPTALYALPVSGARLVGANGTLDFVFEAAIGRGRATVFVLYENVLASRAYAGALVVPTYPLPDPRLRFGVFWLLPN